MAAPEGNKFWQKRSKHGRDKLFSTPELLWEAACEYFEYTDSRKWKKKDWVGKDAEQITRESDTPYNISSLCLYLDCSRQWWYNFKEAKHEDFVYIITRIEEIIYSQKFEGASVGAFNANIIARDLGLKDSTETNLKVEQPLFGDVPKNNNDK